MLPDKKKQVAQKVGMLVLILVVVVNNICQEEWTWYSLALLIVGVIGLILSAIFQIIKIKNQR